MQKFLWLFFVMGSLNVDAQVFIENKTQHRFAQTYIGLNVQTVPASGRLVWDNQSQSFPTHILPRLTIGGLHFWGKLDFNMNIPLGVLADDNLTEEGTLAFNTGADLSVRYYPWRLKYDRLRPFVGVSFNTMQLSLGDAVQGERIEGFITSSFLAGLAFAHRGWQISTEWMFMPQNARDFYSDRQQKHRFKLPQSYFSVGLIKYFDFTLGEEKSKQSGRTKAIEEQLLAQGKLNSFSLGIAPNGSYFTSAPTFSGNIESLPRHKGSFNWEFGLGYLFHKAKLHAGLTYRNYSSNSLSYNLEHVIRREALSLEVFKFLWDYHGFVPFLGASLSAERWATGLFEDDVQQGDTQRSRIFSPGFIFGWDILPSPLETWVLRTNLRYYPFQRIQDIDGKRSRVDQFEFNFIQFVFYPSRWINVRRAKRAH